jgi:predicted AlkP superfamily phosphohydrolase/phosphomutase
MKATSSNNSSRTIVVGLDAMDLRLVERWAARGQLPFLADMLASCPLVSLHTPSRALQGAVWPSILTGVPPGEHGLYLQTQLEVGSHELAPRRTLQGSAKKFYQFLGDAGVRCAVVDIPTDAPLSPFPGVQIVDWGTEFSFWGFAAEPKTLAAEIAAEIGPYPIALERNSGDSQASHTVLMQLLDEGIRRKGALGRHLLERGELDLMFLVFMEAHKAGHWLWKYQDASHPNHEDCSAELRDGILSCYRALDRELAALAALLRPQDNLLVLSDHGMQANFRGNHLAESILEKLGLLVRKGGRPRSSDVVVSGSDASEGRKIYQSGAIRALRRSVPRSLKPLLRELLNVPRVDFARSRAFTLPTDRNTYIRVNLQGREPRGVVAPGAAYERLLDRIEAEFRALINVTTGRPAVSDVLRLRALYPGERAEDLPDIAILWSAEAAIDTVSSPAIGEISRRARELRSGNHREEGFVLARGPAFKSGRARFTGDVLQIAPTLLELHGVAMPRQFAHGPLTSTLRTANVKRRA